MKHRNDVDGLRAVAVIPVLLFHFGTGLFSGGFTGVDVFFVISGYVIAGSIAADIRSGQFSIANFYFKRVRRIFPALAATIIATSIAAALILLPGDLLDYSRSLIATGLFVSNMYFWKSSGYFASAAQVKPLLHTWSLSVEEQFYLFAPIAFALIYRFGHQRWLRFFLPVIALSLIAGIAAVFVGPTAGFFLLPTRAWELLLGSVIALAAWPAPAHRGVREAMGGFGLGLILFGMLTLHEGDPFPGWNALFPCIGSALIIQAGMGATAQSHLPLANRLIATRPFVWIGLISYSLYLVHWPISAFTRYLALRDPTAIEAIAMLIASLMLAWLSWRFVEQPFRKVPRERRTLALCAGLAMILVIVGVGGAGLLSRGLPGRFPDLREQHITGVEDWGGDSCFNQNPAHASLWNAEQCTRIQGDHGRILVWGDSFAAQYMPGILRDAKRIDATVLQYTFAGCPPVLAYHSLARVACAPFNRGVLDVIREQTIDTVVVAGRWSDTPNHTIARLGETVDVLRKMGVRVFVFGQSPQFATDVQHIDYLSGNSGKTGLVDWTVAFDPGLSQRVAAQARDAVFIDPMQRLCRGRICAYRDGDAYLYADYGHFSTEGSLRAVRAYFPSGNKPATR